MGIIIIIIIIYLYRFVGHDTTLLPFLSAFQVFDGLWPPYTSAIIIEIYDSTDSNHQYVRFLYNGNVLKLPFSNRDDELIMLEDFKSHAKKMIPTDFWNECIVNEQEK